jgi:DMSO/TMAO reductase YedYZ molybdopterin-dependent catalytic subunit
MLLDVSPHGFLSVSLGSIVPAQQAWIVFWESLGYHNHGDPWREERYWGD